MECQEERAIEALILCDGTKRIKPFTLQPLNNFVGVPFLRILQKEVKEKVTINDEINSKAKQTCP